jgi:hypothetical protein
MSSLGQKPRERQIAAGRQAEIVKFECDYDALP